MIHSIAVLYLLTLKPSYSFFSYSEVCFNKYNFHIDRLMLKLYEASGLRSGQGRWCFARPRFSGPWRFMKPSEQGLM